MTPIFRFIRQYQTRSLLVFVAAVLLLLNLGRLGLGYFNDRRETVENRLALLDQYYQTSGRLTTLQAKVAALEKQRQQLEVSLFKGASEEEIASAMQILLQGLVVKAGLEPEFLRPVRTGPNTTEREYGEIAIKVRLAGNLNGFIEFIRALYRSRYLFRVDSLILKPYRETDLKIFMEIKGFYKTIRPTRT